MYKAAYDGPSTSGYGQLQAQNSEDLEDKDPKDEAFEDLVEKVSVAGWKEALSERIPWIRQMYIVSLLFLSGCSLYYSYASIQQWVNSGYKDEISDIASLESLAMPNVTICPQVYFNQTYVRENVYVPPAVWHQYEASTGHTREEFYRQLTLFLSLMSRPREFTTPQLIYFYKIFRANPQMLDYTAFSDEATLPCEHLFRKCTFNGEEFDCCRYAVKSFDDDGICYLLALNMDSDNAEPVPSTFLQTKPGPRGGLTVETSVQVKDFPWFEDDAQNGFRVYINHVPYSITSSPMGAPHAAETFIKVKLRKHKLATRCSPHGHLNAVDSKRIYEYYDPEGISCALKVYLDVIWTFGQCEMPSYLYRPHVNISCNPNFIYTSTRMFAIGDMEKSFGHVSTKDFSAAHGTKVVEDHLRSMLSHKANCPHHCQYFMYDTRSSFSYLEPATEASALEDSKQMRSIIHVYYHELEYRQHEETKELTFYLMFCDLGNAWGLYWGMSIVSFFHVLFYLIRYLYYLRRGTKPLQLVPVSVAKVRNVRVRPVNVATTKL